MLISRVAAAVFALAVGFAGGAWGGASYAHREDRDDDDDDKVTICHATGSTSHPYEMIRVNKHALGDKSRERGKHAGDFIPADGSDCSAGPATSGGGTTTPPTPPPVPAP